MEQHAEDRDQLFPFLDRPSVWCGMFDGVKIEENIFDGVKLEKRT
jgi:hypothetical protein